MYSILILYICIRMLVINDISISLIYSTLILISQLGLAFFVIRGTHSDKLLLILFYIASLYLLIQYQKGVNPSNVIIWSENIVSFIIFSLSISVYLVRYLKGKKFLVHPAIISTIVSFWTTGRAGIIASLLLLITILIFKLNFKIKYISLIICGSILLFYTDTLLKNIEIFRVNLATRGGTREGFTNNVRLEIWKDYFNKLDVKSFFLGFDSNNISFFGFHNLHNSFLDGLFNFGFFMLIVYLLIIGSLIKLTIRKKYFIVILFLIFLLRGMTDTVIFSGRFDYVYIAILLYSYIFYQRYDSLKQISHKLKKESKSKAIIERVDLY